MHFMYAFSAILPSIHPRHAGGAMTIWCASRVASQPVSASLLLPAALPLPSGMTNLMSIMPIVGLERTVGAWRDGRMRPPATGTGRATPVTFTCLPAWTTTQRHARRPLALPGMIAPTAAGSERMGVRMQGIIPNSCGSDCALPCCPGQVFYRERGAAMYDPFAYGLAMAVVELPYLLLQVRQARGGGGAFIVCTDIKAHVYQCCV
jgi:hypothetical protein